MAQYYRPQGRNTARSVALTPWAQGLLLTTWPGPAAWNFAGSGLDPVVPPAPPYLTFGFSAAAHDGSGDAILAGYFGGAIRIAANSVRTNYQYPADAFFSGVAYVGSQPYFLQTTGDIYTLSGSSLIQMSGSFGEEAAALSTDGTKLYATLPDSQQLGILTFTGLASGTVTKVGTPMEVPAMVAASASGVAVGGWDRAILASGATAMSTDGQGRLIAAIASGTGTLMLLEGPGPDWQIIQVITGLSTPIDVIWTSADQQVMVSESTRVHLYDLGVDVLTPGQTITLSGPTALAPIPGGHTVLACLTAANTVQVLRNTLNVWSADESFTVSNSPNFIADISDTQMVCAYAPGGTGGGLVWMHEVSGTWSVQSTLTGLGYTVSGLTVDTSGNVYTCGTNGGNGGLSVSQPSGIFAGTLYAGRADAVFWEQGQIAVIDNG
jgi:hypothetical protein